MHGKRSITILMLMCVVENGFVMASFTYDKGGGKCFCPCLFVCLSVGLLAKLLKNAWWIWMKCCVSTDVGTWTNWLTFEPDPDYSPDAGTGLLSPISHKRCNAEFYYVGKIPRIGIGRPSLQRGVVLKWFYSSRAVETFCRRYALYRVPF